MKKIDRVPVVIKPFTQFMLLMTEIKKELGRVHSIDLSEFCMVKTNFSKVTPPRKVFSNDKRKYEFQAPQGTCSSLFLVWTVSILFCCIRALQVLCACLD